VSGQATLSELMVNELYGKITGFPASKKDDPKYP
jgi:hypothetical protein